MKSFIIMKKILLLTLLLFSGVWTSLHAQPPIPNAETDQYFCSQNAWALIGEDRDYLSDLQIFPDQVGWSVTWYQDAALSTQVSDPTIEALVDGATYYVTQTNVQGNESDALEITVIENSCACIKDPTFEDQNGNPSARGYEFLQYEGIANHKTCGQDMSAATSLSMGSVDGYFPMGVDPLGVVPDDAVLVTPGPDPSYIDRNGGVVGTIPQTRTNPNNPSSSHALRINRGAEYGGVPSGGSIPGTNITSMEKNFIGGEIISFSFALNIQDPGHSYEQQPFAQVRLYDQAGNVVRQRCLVSDENDCVFNSQGTGSNSVLYSDWTCLKFNTSDLQGEALKLEIVTAYCTPSQHWTYMYVDDIYVGDNEPGICGDSAFGYASIDDVENTGSSNCYIMGQQSEEDTCVPGGSTRQIEGFPLEVCGTYDVPQSTGNVPNIDEIELEVSQGGVVVGTVTSPTQGANANEFCFTISASDINVSPYGEFTFDLGVDFVMDCGDPYNFVINDQTTYDLCPSAGCPNPLVVCDDLGGGIGVFDLTQSESVILDQWSANDMSITYYEDEDDAFMENNDITDPSNYNNSIPYDQTIFVRVDWESSGATGSSCSYLVELPLIVNESPIVNIEDEIAFCSDEQAAIIATPENLTNLTNVSYVWFKDGIQLPTTASYIQTEEPGEYTVTVSEENCEVSKTVQVVAVDFEAELEDEIAICVDLSGEGSATLSPAINDSSNPAMDVSLLEYSWSTGETTTDISVSESGNYFVDITYKGCTETAAVSVFIDVQPDVSLGEDIIACLEDTEATNIIAKISNYDDHSELVFEWYKKNESGSSDLGTRLNENSETLTLPHIDSSVGVYAVKVYPIGSPDCFSLDEVSFSLYKNENCTITQGLSPSNMDGLNDCLDLAFLNDRTGIRNLSLFNRYGRIIYEKPNYIDSWCGQDQDGNELPTGTYYYVLELDGEDPVFGNSKKGWIYINREVN